MSGSSLSFQPSCPSGGSWYACGNGVQFVGCCTTNPCTSTGCPSSNLKPASFLASAFGTFPNQECTSGSWYTCSLTTPTFFGCCTSNPCQPGGCPSQNLRAGQLSSNSAIANRYNPSPPLSGSSSSSTRTSSSTTTSSRSSSTTTSTTTTRTSSRTSSTFTSSTSSITSSSSSSSQTNTPTAIAVPASDSSSRAPTGAVAGAAAGGAILLAILVSAIIFVWRMRRHTKEKRSQQPWFKPPEKRYEALSQADSTRDSNSSYPPSTAHVGHSHSHSYPPVHPDYPYAQSHADYPYPESHADYNYQPSHADNSYPLQDRPPLSVYTAPPVPVAVPRSGVVSPIRSPTHGHHEAASREVPIYVPYSPTRMSAPPEPRYDTLSGRYDVPDSNVRGVRGNTDYRRAELG